MRTGVAIAIISSCLCLDAEAGEAPLDGGVGVQFLPYPEDTEQVSELRQKTYRGKVYPFAMPPSVSEARYDYGVYLAEEGASSSSVNRSLRISFDRSDSGFCGVYVVLLANVSEFKTMHFRVRGDRGGENFLVGLKDLVSHDREDAIYGGSIYRYLPEGVSQAWQDVAIPLRDFHGLDLENFFGLSLLFEDEGSGVLYVDHIRFSHEEMERTTPLLASSSSLLLDDFDHADINALGMPSGCYSKLPSLARFERDDAARKGSRGKGLHVQYKKAAGGWAGYYSQLHVNKEHFTDLSSYNAIAFSVKGEKGNEVFTVGLADRHHILLDDVVHLDSMEPYLPGGTPTQWADVVIPFHAFEDLEFDQMGSVIIDFPQESRGDLYIDNLRFLATDEVLSQVP